MNMKNLLEIYRKDYELAYNFGTSILCFIVYILMIPIYFKFGIYKFLTIYDDPNLKYLSWTLTVFMIVGAIYSAIFFLSTLAKKITKEKQKQRNEYHYLDRKDFPFFHYEIDGKEIYVTDDYSAYVSHIIINGGNIVIDSNKPIESEVNNNKYFVKFKINDESHRVEISQDTWIYLYSRESKDVPLLILTKEQLKQIKNGMIIKYDFPVEILEPIINMEKE